MPADAARRPSGRPTAAGAAELAERILGVATRAFLADGYAATSIETIAASAGVAKRTLYARWRDKPALFRAVLERLMARWLATPEPSPMKRRTPGRHTSDHPTPDHQMAQRAAAEHPVSAADRLEDALVQTAGRVLAVALQPDALALHRLMIAESGRFPELAEMVRQTGAAAGMARIAGLLAGEMVAGRLASLDPAIAAEQFLYLVLTGPQRRALGLAPPLDPADLEAWSRQAVTLFLNGCRLRAGSATSALVARTPVAGVSADDTSTTIASVAATATAGASTEC
jgi:TetR/AcrR family transcriptional regulator, mexJK operon transcriptional repressor